MATMFEGGNKLRRLSFAALFTLAASFVPAQGGMNQTCGTPTTLDDGWTIASPESVGLDAARLCGIAARLKETEANAHAVIIVRHGKLVFEQYFAGYDEPWGEDAGRHEFDATTKHDMRSASKSVISLLIGIAIDRKLIASANEPVAKFFPEYSALQSPGWNNITLRHLLTMSSGIKWDENRDWKDPANDEPHLSSEPDPLR
jgi:CubicO group peptidase (beta-lactamase class C family)